MTCCLALQRVLPLTILLVAVTAEVPERSAGERLATDLLQNYVEIATPDPHVTVDIGYKIQYLQYSEYTGTLKVTLHQYLSWSDNRLAWSPAQYGGLQSISVPSDQIWTPDVTFYNNIESAVTGSTDAVVSTDGTVIWVAQVIGKVYCPAGTKDSNRSKLYQQLRLVDCQLWFGSWTRDASQLTLQEAPGGGPVLASEDRQFGAGHRVLKATSEVEKTVYACCPDPYYTYHLNITLAPPFSSAIQQRILQL